MQARVFFLSHTAKADDVEDSTLVKDAIAKAMLLDFGKSRESYRDWDASEIPDCPIYGDIAPTSRICLGTSFDPLIGGVGVETDFSFTGTFNTRMHPVSMPFCDFNDNSNDCILYGYCEWTGSQCQLKRC